VSLPAIQSIETGRLRLSNKLAERISFETGIGAEWLTRDNLSRKPVDFLGTPYEKSTFETMQAEKQGMAATLFRNHKALTLHFTANVVSIAAIMAKAFQTKKGAICHFKLQQALGDITSELGITPSDTDHESLMDAAGCNLKNLGGFNRLPDTANLQPIAKWFSEQTHSKKAKK
jgi:hypothetical protein